MKSKSWTAMAFGLVLIASACKKHAPPATAEPVALGAPSGDGDPKAIDDFLALNKKLADGLRKADKDCDRVAEVAAAFARDHGHELKALVPKLNQWVDSVSPEISHAFEMKHVEDTQVRLDASGNCIDDAAAKTALDLLDALF